MPNPQQYKQIEDKIKELVPSLTCNCDNGHVFEGYESIYEEDGSISQGDPIWGGCPDCVINGMYTPYGRPITLQDLLYCIKNREGYNGDGLLSTDDWGMDIGNYDVAKLFKFYDLSKPFNEQSDDFYQFCYNLICK